MRKVLFGEGGLDSKHWGIVSIQRVQMLGFKSLVLQDILRDCRSAVDESFFFEGLRVE